MATLTKKQKDVFDFIASYHHKRGVSPTLEEISRHFKRAVGTIHEHIEELAKKGFIKKNNSVRGIELKERSEMIRIPLLGTIAAGQPIEAVEEKEIIAIPKEKLPSNGNTYALRVAGDSMIDENINDGDYVIVKQQSTAENGQKVVALIDNNEATLKKFYREKNKIKLQPSNQNMLPLFFENSRVDLQGIVIDIIKSNNEKNGEENLHKMEEQKKIDSKPQAHKIKISSVYQKDADVILFHGDRLDLMRSLPDKSIKLIVTSPPYNIGKEYEKRRDLNIYLKDQEDTIKESVRILSNDGSLCWQVGNHISKDGEIFPLDALIYPICKKFGLKLRNRIIWYFGHGLHCTHRFSGRHETILWFTKSDNYTFNLDTIRVPQKYPGKKNFKKNEKYGTLSCNPLGKNPSDVWEIPNVKSNHPEKTNHPCQFPIELIERLVLSMTNEKDTVFDPYAGVGSTLCAAVLHNRKGYGTDIMKEYLDIAKKRIESAVNGTLKRRPMGTPVYQPGEGMKLAELPEEFAKIRNNLLFGSRSRTTVFS